MKARRSIPQHPPETDLALLASRDCGLVRALALRRHVRRCAACTAKFDGFAALRQELAAKQEINAAELPDIAWESLALEMRANIRLGLEAGQCVRVAPPDRASWNPRIAVAFASLIALIASSVFLGSGQHRRVRPSAPAVLQSTAEGVAVRAGDNTLELLNHTGSVTDQTVSAQGQIGVRYVDDTGAVTINNVYLQ